MVRLLPPSGGSALSVHSVVPTACRTDGEAGVVELVVAPPEKRNGITARAQPACVVTFGACYIRPSTKKVDRNGSEIERAINWRANHSLSGYFVIFSE